MTVLYQADFDSPDWAGLDAPPQQIADYVSQVLSSYPLAYWRLGDAGSGVAVDSAGNFDGTYAAGYSGVSDGAIFRDPDGAVVLDKDAGLITTSATSLLNNATQCTIHFWLRHDVGGITQDGSVVNRFTNNEGFLVWVDIDALGTPNTLSFAVHPWWTVTQEALVSGTADMIVPDQWDFYACVYSANQYLRIYRNGEIVGEKTQNIMSAIQPGTKALRIGHADFSTLASMDGSLDELVILDQALDASAIQMLFRLGRGIFHLEGG